MFPLLIACSLAFLTPLDDDAALAAAQRPTYPLERCLVSGEPLGSMGDPLELVHAGTLVRLCCSGCVADFEREADEHVAAIARAVIEDQSEGYPLEVCLVSGEPLGGAMGEPIDHVLGTRLVRLCCAGCIKELEREPSGPMATLDRAYVAAQLEDYPLTTCVVSQEELVEGEIIDMLYGNRLVRLCCAPCEKKVRADPATFLSALVGPSAETGRNTERPESHPSSDHDGHDHDGSDHDGHDHDGHDHGRQGGGGREG